MDSVNHPSHYRSLGAECSECGADIEVIQITERMDFIQGNIVKYVLRAPHKGNQLEDLKKARWYLEREIERVESHEALERAHERDRQEQIRAKRAKEAHDALTPSIIELAEEIETSGHIDRKFEEARQAKGEDLTHEDALDAVAKGLADATGTPGILIRPTAGAGSWFNIGTVDPDAIGVYFGEHVHVGDDDVPHPAKGGDLWQREVGSPIYVYGDDELGWRRR